METNGFICRGKLTKKFFSTLPVGVFLVSNCYEKLSPKKSTPLFYEYTESPEGRKTQWERIKTVGADQRLCDVFESSEAFKKDVECKTARNENYPVIVVCEMD